MKIPNYDLKSYPAIALIEFDNIPAGITAADAMVKKASLKLLEAGTIHPGKYIVLIGGDVGSVEESYKEGLGINSESLVDDVFLPDVHKQVFDAVFGKTKNNKLDALGVIETSTVASNIKAADSGVKGAEVIINEIRLADDLGGKSFTIFAGNVENVQAAVEIGVGRIKDKDIKIKTTIIPRIDEWIASRIGISSRFFLKGEG